MSLVLLLNSQAPVIIARPGKLLSLAEKGERMIDIFEPVYHTKTELDDRLNWMGTICTDA